MKSDKKPKKLVGRNYCKIMPQEPAGVDDTTVTTAFRTPSQPPQHLHLNCTSGVAN